MGFRVEGVTEASLTSDVFVACLFQDSWRVLAGLVPSALSEAVCKLREAQKKNQPQGAGLRLRSRVGNCKSPSAIRRYSQEAQKVA